MIYYVALPFIRNEEGELMPGGAQDRQSASAAEASRDAWPTSHPAR